MARRVPRAKSFSFDLLADWRPYADPPPEGGEWVYYGTATLNGETGVLAWAQHRLPRLVVRGRDPYELQMWERSELNIAISLKAAPGWDGVAPLQRAAVVTLGSAAMRYPIAIEPGTETTAYGVAVPDIPGCFSAGDTLEEAIRSAKEAILFALEDYASSGRAAPRASSMQALMNEPEFAGWIWAEIEVGSPTD